MTPEELETIKEIAEALRTDMATSLAALDKKCDAIADSFEKIKKKADAAGERSGENEDDLSRDHLAAKRVAADRQARPDSVDPAAFAALSSSVAELKKRQSRPMSDLNAFADAQSKADAVLRTHNERAEPPMAGEELVAYQIRMHRKMQPHSSKWKGVDLGDHRGGPRSVQQRVGGNSRRRDTGRPQPGRPAAVPA